MPDKLIERLKLREQKRRDEIANCKRVVGLMQPELDRFDKRDGTHNTYAVRMAVDHQSSIRTTEQEADELAEAAAEIERLREALGFIRLEAERENGGWVHLKRAIAVQARAALKGGPNG